ncbi:Ig-like domain-containing protein, partial [Sulfurimonas sp.]|nr:Ig-like domain-containing protein [Sulfurimonas sp.]
NGGTDTATVNMTITAGNDDPVAVDDSITAVQNTLFTSTVDLDFNDTDLDGDALSVTAGTFTTDNGGSLVLASDGSYTYKSATGFTGNDTVDYTVIDSNGGSDVGTLNITVEPLFSVSATSNSIAEGGVITGFFSADFTPNYAEWTIDLSNTNATSVSLDLNNGSISGGSILDPSNSDSFDYSGLQYKDTSGNWQDIPLTLFSNKGTVNVATSDTLLTVRTKLTPDLFKEADEIFHLDVTVDGITNSSEVTIQNDDFNRAPVANDDSYSVDEDSIVTLDLLSNDTDPDAGLLITDAINIKSINGTDISGSAQSIAVPNGTVNIDGSGVVTFSPSLNYYGAVAFDYIITDGVLEDTGSVSINVAAVNDAPVAVDDTITATEDTPFTSTIDLDANDTDLDGDTLSVADGTFTTAQGGTVVIATDGSYTYTPKANFNGIDTVDYTVTDGSLSDIGTLTINVVSVVDTFTDNNESVNGLEDTTQTGTVLENAVDTNGFALSVTAFSVGSQTGTVGSALAIADVGSLTINSNGSYTFVPVANYSGTVPTATYTVSNTESTDTSTLDIYVTPVADTLVTVNPDGTITEIADIEVGNGTIVTSDGTFDDTTNTINGIELTATSTNPDGSITTADISYNNGQGFGVGENGEFRIENDTDDKLSFNIPFSSDGMTMEVKNIIDEVVQVSADRIDGSKIVWQFFESGAKSVQSYVKISITEDSTTTTTTLNDNEALFSDYFELKSGNDSDVLNLISSVPYNNLVITDANVDGSNGANGFTIDTIYPSADSTYTYPVDVGAALTDTDTSESITALLVSGFPENSVLYTFRPDGTKAIIDTTIDSPISNSGSVFSFDDTAFLNSLVVDGTFTDNIYVETQSQLATDFEATMALETSDVVDGVTSKAYTILGGSDDATFSGSAGGDYIDGGAGTDSISTGAGNDTIKYDSADTLLDGGVGEDTLVFDQNNIDIDFSNISSVVANIETVNLTGGNQITLSLSDVLDVTDSDNTLRIEGGNTDTVALDTTTTGEWTLGDTLITDASTGETYKEYTGTDSSNNSLTLEVSTNIIIVDES